MFYWIIPFLVGYNVSETANWKNGPIHSFEAEVRSNLTHEDVIYQSDFTLLFACRPINASFIECQTRNATIDNYTIYPNDSNPVRVESISVYEPFLSMNFNVGFDKAGVKNVTFPQGGGYFREKIIQSIVGDLNVGIDITDGKFGNYIVEDKSINGVCETSFVIDKKARCKKEISMKDNPLITKMMIASFGIDLSDEETIVIEKERKMNKCAIKTPYVFGSDEITETERKRGFKAETDIISSRSRISLGKNRFNIYTDNAGILKMGKDGGKMMSIDLYERIRLTLIGIDGGTNENVQ